MKSLRWYIFFIKQIPLFFFLILGIAWIIIKDCFESLVQKIKEKIK